jgi:hypothetical protein
VQNSSVGAYTSRGFVEVLAASQSNVRKEWFQGTADAVRQYMWLFEEAMRDGVEDFLILSGQAWPGGGVSASCGQGPLCSPAQAERVLFGPGQDGQAVAAGSSAELAS